MLVEIGGFGPEALDDLGIRGAVLDHGIDLVADGFGEAGDFAGAAGLRDGVSRTGLI